MIFFISPFLLQGGVMFFDEFYFHRKRGLPLWERIGHPIDTLSVLLCFLFLYFKASSETNLTIYIALCSFSCLLITKDEWVHAELCEPTEQWLHSLLFVLHPIAFTSAAFIWREGTHQSFLLMQIIVLTIFMIYQLTYWSLYGQSK